MYAIIATGGKQYKVSEGDSVFVERLPGEAGDEISFDEVLFIGGDDVKVGNPTVAGASVKGSIEEQGRHKKVIVYRYKPKKGYHKKNGHRQQFTKVKITSINA